MRINPETRQSPSPEQKLLADMHFWERKLSEAERRIQELLRESNDFASHGGELRSPLHRETLGNPLDLARANIEKTKEELSEWAVSNLEKLLSDSEGVTVPTGTYEAVITFPCIGGDIKTLKTVSFEISDKEDLADLIKKSLKAVAASHLYSQGMVTGNFGLAQVEIQANKIDSDSAAFQSPAWNLWLDIDGEPLSRENRFGFNKSSAKPVDPKLKNA